ncbi:MAG: hypothetical protein IPM52_02550 [Bacteroidetes bacterium]|nr:hypothetical protein [Bacteroidota bacterium]
MRDIRILLYLSLLSLLLTACGRHGTLTGFWGVEVQFSPHETQHTGLVLFDDSTFYYFNRPNKELPWSLKTGTWTMRSGKIYLASDGFFNLWLQPKGNQLEILDFEGDAVISGKPVQLARTSAAPWSDEISVPMTGKLLLIESEPYFLPCNTFHFIRLAPLTDQQLGLVNQSLSVMLSVVPARVHTQKAEAIRLGGVFGPTECR